MSAKIPANMEIKDLLKSTGYDCPEDLQNKTFAQATSGSGGGGGGSGNLTTKTITAQMIHNAVENGQAITPPDGVDGFSEIVFPDYLLTEEEIVVNGTKEFGIGSAPYFPKKVTVNVASDYTVETKSFDKNSETFTLDCSDKTFVYMMTIANNAVGKGIAGLVSDLTNDFQVYISASDSTVGLMSWDANTKTITYSPNAGSQVSDAVTFNLVTI